MSPLCHFRQPAARAHPVQAQCVVVQLVHFATLAMVVLHFATHFAKESLKPDKIEISLSLCV
jgi:hypothetical protein